MRRRLRRIEPEQAERDAEAVARRVLALPAIRKANHVLLCLSFGIELDTWRLADRLAARGVQTYVPRVALADRSFHVHPFPCRLVTSAMGLRQPEATEPELDDTEVCRIDIALILGLAFDHRGVRLGYGGGFFDRFLGRHRLPAIGLGYDEQIVDRLPREEHDVPMDWLVTPTGVLAPDRQ